MNTYINTIGVVLYYVTLQLALWWFLHVLILFWKVEFPFHARSFENAGRFKYIHIIWATVGVLLPLVPVITVLANGGFTIPQFPPLLCTGREADPTFYSLLLPIIVLLQTGITLMVILFRTIHKVSKTLACIAGTLSRMCNYSHLYISTLKLHIISAA